MTERSGAAAKGSDASATSPASLLPPTEPPRPKPPPRRTPAPRGPVATAAACGVLAVSLLGSATAVRWAAGEMWVQDPAGSDLQRAHWATPSNPLLWRRLALRASYSDGEAQAAVEPLARAAALDPLNVDTVSAWATHLEAAGESASAEERLLAAAERDPGFAPRWDLANFYLRQGDEERFWEWIRSAVSANLDYLPAALALCWRAFDDAALIQERGLPDERPALRRYFTFLADTKRADALRLLWQRLRPEMESVDVPLAAELIELLLDEGELEEALASWNELAERGLVLYRPLAPESGPFLTNGDFEGRISNLGFDWRLDPVASVDRVQRATDGGSQGLEIRLAGGQEDGSVLLSQIVPLAGGRDFTLRFQYATQGLTRDTGLGWAARDYASGDLLARSDTLLAADQYWDESRFTFQAPAGLHAVRLEFEFRAAESSGHPRGRILLRRLNLTATDAEAPQ